MNYEHEDFLVPVSDAAHVAATLREYGFDITASEVRELREFCRIARFIGAQEAEEYFEVFDIILEAIGDNL